MNLDVLSTALQTDCHNERDEHRISLCRWCAKRAIPIIVSALLVTPLTGLAHTIEVPLDETPATASMRYCQTQGVRAAGARRRDFWGHQRLSSTSPSALCKRCSWVMSRVSPAMRSMSSMNWFMRARAALFPRLFANDSYPPNTLLVVDCLVKEEFLIEVEAAVRV